MEERKPMTAPQQPDNPHQAAEPHAEMLDALFDPKDLIDVRGIEIVVDENGKETKIDRYRPWSMTEQVAEVSLSPDFDRLNMIIGINRRAWKSGKEQAVKRCVNIAVDIDIADLQEADIVRMIKESGYPPPTVLVFSGRGWHVWWRLEKHISKAGWKRAQAAARAALGADDNVCKPAHCLRLAGTVN